MKGKFFLMIAVCCIAFSASAVQAQTTAFTYQGRLSDSSMAANGTYDLRFGLFDAASGGTQIGATLTRPAVNVSNGVFTVQLDFGASAFPGANRFLEIAVKGSSDANFTTLSPRQQLTSSPYSIQSLSATSADRLSANCVGCVTNANINSLDGTKITGAVASSTNATTATNFSGSLSGDVSGTQGATVVNTVGGQTSASVADATANVAAATAANIANTIVRRDAVGGFATGVTSITNQRLTIAVGANSTDALRIESLPDSQFFQNGLFARFRSYRSSGPPLADKFRFDQAGGLVAIGELGVGIISAQGSGERMMWFPFKAAFRAGSVNAGGTTWDDVNTGFYSWAGGVSTTASGLGSFAMGNATMASGQSSFAMGAATTASGLASFAIGSSTTASGTFTTALGRYASTGGFSGSFVYGDNRGSTSNIVTSDAENSWTIRASGGYRFFTNSNLTTGVTLSAGGGAWNSVSDRNAKENFGAVNSRDILQAVLKLPIATWSYKGQTYRHIGAMAQDFYAAFKFGESDKTITTVDPDGVALAAIQGLHEELKDGLKERDAKIETQQKQLNELQTQIEALQKLICQMNKDAEICSQK